MVQTVMGSPESGGGTWMHRIAALETVQLVKH